MKLKPEAIGVKTFTQTLGFITVQERHLPILLREGRHDLIDGILEAKQLVALENKLKSELREIAKDLDGYNDNLKKQELIDLINATPTAD